MSSLTLTSYMKMVATLRGSQARRVNEFALLTTLFISGLVLASCSHDLAMARVSVLAQAAESNEFTTFTVYRKAGAAVVMSQRAGFQTPRNAFAWECFHQCGGPITPHEFRGKVAFNMADILTTSTRESHERLVTWDGTNAWEER